MLPVGLRATIIADFTKPFPCWLLLGGGGLLGGTVTFLKGTSCSVMTLSLLLDIFLLLPFVYVFTKE
jgi:hypothetical protein